MKPVAIIILLATLQQCRAGIVADTIWLEARGEPRAGQVAVASVIYNRAQNRGLTFEEVCLQPRQFSCWNSGRRELPLSTKRGKAILAYLETLERAMYAGTFKPAGDWTHYYNPSVCSPSWGRGFNDRIGNHVFGKAR